MNLNFDLSRKRNYYCYENLREGVKINGNQINILSSRPLLELLILFVALVFQFGRKKFKKKLLEI